MATEEVKTSKGNRAPAGELPNAVSKVLKGLSLQRKLLAIEFLNQVVSEDKEKQIAALEAQLKQLKGIK